MTVKHHSSLRTGVVLFSPSLKPNNARPDRFVNARRDVVMMRDEGDSVISPDVCVLCVHTFIAGKLERRRNQRWKIAS